VPFPKTCRGCGQSFVADRLSTEFHSRPCYAQWRERTPEWQAAKRRGQLKSAATGRQKAQQLYEQKVSAAGSKGEAFRTGHREGYRLGWKRGERVGFANGYELAIQEMERGKRA
jgi:flagellar biosynthesis/type III secretory pathway protein FliH